MKKFLVAVASLVLAMSAFTSCNSETPSTEEGSYVSVYNNIDDKALFDGTEFDEVTVRSGSEHTLQFEGVLEVHTFEASTFVSFSEALNTFVYKECE